ncbi:MAG: hypothetical protein A3E01_05890 [Gammaproteobacteria bacterium RIFCSPHIGHO2_12_FULL_63_22]|nr:MAG: hypothetical protein A3E01_05890 [Gammaproteobacteria bacterium RIFCSPHIGHO2_12_FULL_63_22]
MAGEPKAFVLYLDGAGEWRWRLFAPNAKVIADSAEGYRDRADAIHGIHLVAQIAPDTNIWDPAQKKWVVG